MPSVVENQVRWTGHPWERQGHEWSPGGTAAGGEVFWWRGLFPRIYRHLPAVRLLEIGPGFGRWSSHLIRHADQVFLVDVTERCVEHCRRRFGGRGNVHVFRNDGVSLDMIDDASVDFVFSFDSLVHADAVVVRDYLRQLARKLRPGGTGFIHHSNLAALATSDGTLPWWVARTHWRAESMSAARFREYCREAGLVCETQEVINWVGRSRKKDRHRIHGPGIPMIDAISTFRRPAETPVKAADPGPTRVYVNPLFVHEWRQCTVLAELYGPGVSPADHRTLAHNPGTTGGPALHQRLITLLNGARTRVEAVRDHAGTLSRDRFYASQVRRKEPILNALLRHRCPDCGGALDSEDSCERCAVRFFYPRPR